MRDDLLQTLMTTGLAAWGRAYLLWITMAEGWLTKIGNELLDLVYPPGLYCISCGKIIDDSRTYRLCNDCMHAVNWISEARCMKCGRPLSENDPGPLCFNCSARRASDRHYAFDKGHVCAGYGSVEQAVIFDLKYGGKGDIGETLGEILHDRMLSEYGHDTLADMYDYVIPVPIHKERKNRRGFNHADLMAKSFAKRAGLSCDADVLVRTRQTLPMKGLGPLERVANIHGAFEIRERKLPLIKDARMLLVDDIFTTGATINEIAALLKDPSGHGDGNTGRHTAKLCGAKRVDFLAFAAAGDMII